ncbi:hypothetical protein AMTRI_Chr04g247780 [Amborella trichopoda]|nr:HMG-Y-related protein A [Amborella trichopoda]|eukprot:XP_006838026.2 HMG-Y-related protein A [Amborella trichopoda]
MASTSSGSPPKAASSPSHPPYVDMIISAITALKEENGSSKRAIDKYMEANYPNLPPTHTALLAHHLRRLKECGELVMVKNSYKLPNQAEPQAEAGAEPGPEEPTNAEPTGEPIALVVTQVGPSPTKSGRPRGRPRKSKPTVVPIGPPRPRGRPPKPRSAAVLAAAVAAKPFPRPRGRPPKPRPDGSVSPVVPIRPPRPRGRPPKSSGTGARRGRPPKVPRE